RNNVRAAYIHTSEHFDDRRLMIQWRADYLDALNNNYITPFDFAKIQKNY
ncbi:integrase, partial [Escherichia coli]